MTEDGGHGADGATVDSVAGQLASRLGAVGESAGEVMRRDVRTAAGGAESIALLVQADTDGADRLTAQLPELPGRTAGDADTGPAPEASAGPHRNPSDRLPAGDDMPGPPRTAGPDVSAGTSQAGTPDARPSPGDAGAQEREPATPGPRPAVVPGSERAGTTPTGPVGTESAPGPETPGAAAAAADPARQPGIAPADRGEGPPSAAPSQTPWTPGHSGGSPEPDRNEAAGTTPWNPGAHHPMPHMPGIPGGLPSLPTPQERPPRGNPPWSRGRGGGTAFPRTRPEGHVPGRVD
ncbi:hypothetical protein [Nocardia carnea]|uniref:hypothetical protein n=1 Tax=Nocardia carnea TaxID=37328 RepID=UPI002458A81B|nr:hypothetical protein [Nocardia carnea]